MRITSYIKRLLSAKDEASIKRFIVLFTFLHFALASYLILFGVVRTTVDKDMMKFILDCDYYIILVGLGVIGAENIASVLAQRAVGLGQILSTGKKTTSSSETTEIKISDDINDNAK